MDDQFCDYCLEKKEELVEKVLLDNSTLALTATKSGRPALMWACLGGSISIVKQLLFLGCDPNQPDDTLWTCAHICASTGAIEILQILVHYGIKLDQQNQTGQSPLHYASSKNRLQVLQLLLQNGCNPSVADTYGATPLHRSCSVGHSEVTDLLLQFKAQINSTDCEGNTPLHLACEGNHHKICASLLKAGADPKILNKDEKLAVSLATEMEISRLVRSYMDDWELSFTVFSLTVCWWSFGFCPSSYLSFEFQLFIGNWVFFGNRLWSTLLEEHLLHIYFRIPILTVLSSFSPATLLSSIELLYPHSSRALFANNENILNCN